MTVTQTNTTPITNALDPPPEPGRDLPSPSRPLPGIPKPGDLPAQPRPGDPPPSEPKPGSPGPIRPQTVATLLLLLVLLPAMGLAQPAEYAIDDNDILEAVEADLRFDDAIAADSVDVTVDVGVVTLSGMASTLFAKRRAVRLVASLKGVARSWTARKCDRAVAAMNRSSPTCKPRCVTIRSPMTGRFT